MNLSKRNETKYEEARNLRKQGWRLQRIADEIEVHRSTVQRWVADLPILRHVLDDVDIDNKTATCVICGPTKIRKAGDRWLCLYTAKLGYERATKSSMKQFYNYLVMQKCTDCGETNPIVLEFDHLAGKKYNVSDMVRKGYKWETIMTEIDKCEVVCANCHRIRTNKRGDWFRYALSQE